MYVNLYVSRWRQIIIHGVLIFRVLFCAGVSLHSSARAQMAHNCMCGGAEGDQVYVCSPVMTVVRRLSRVPGPRGSQGGDTLIMRAPSSFLHLTPPSLHHPGSFFSFTSLPPRLLSFFLVYFISFFFISFTSVRSCILLAPDIFFVTFFSLCAVSLYFPYSLHLCAFSDVFPFSFFFLSTFVHPSRLRYIIRIFLFLYSFILLNTLTLSLFLCLSISVASLTLSFSFFLLFHVHKSISPLIYNFFPFFHYFISFILLPYHAHPPCLFFFASFSASLYSLFSLLLNYTFSYLLHSLLSSSFPFLQAVKSPVSSFPSLVPSFNLSFLSFFFLC